LINSILSKASYCSLPITLKKLVLCVAWYQIIPHLCVVKGNEGEQLRSPFTKKDFKTY
jgi:hypothetical protein